MVVLMFIFLFIIKKRPPTPNTLAYWEGNCRMQRPENLKQGGDHSHGRIHRIHSYRGWKHFATFATTSLKLMLSISIVIKKHKNKCMKQVKTVV